MRDPLGARKKKRVGGRGGILFSFLEPENEVSVTALRLRERFFKLADDQSLLAISRIHLLFIRRRRVLSRQPGYIMNVSKLFITCAAVSLKLDIVFFVAGRLL